MTRWRELAKREDGQALVMVALAMFVLLGCMVLVFDAGSAYVARREQQNAADAASMACARLLAMGIATDPVIVSEINKYAGLNAGGIDWVGETPQYVDGSGNVLGPVGTGMVPGGAAGVQVVSQRQLTGIFSQIFNVESYVVASVAAAVSYQAETPDAMPGLIPLGVPKLDFEAGRSYDIWSPRYASIYQVPPGNQWKGVLDFRGFSNHTVCPDSNKPGNTNCWTTNGLDGEIRKGDSIPLYNGNLGNNVASGLEAQVDRQNLWDSGGKYGVVLLPVYDHYDTDTGKIRVAAFAAFKVYENDINGSSCPGVFVSFVVPDGKVGGGGVPWGPRVVKLVRPGAAPTPAPTSTQVTPPTFSPTEEAAEPTSTTVPMATATSTTPLCNCYSKNKKWQCDDNPPGCIEWGP